MFFTNTIWSCCEYLYKCISDPDWYVDDVDDKYECLFSSIPNVVISYTVKHAIFVAHCTIIGIHYCL